MAKDRSLTIKFLADVKDFVKGTALGGQAAEGLAGKLGGLAGTIGSAYAVGKVVEFGKASVEAAMDDAQAQTVLAATLRNTTGATDDQIASVEDFIAKVQDATGVMDDELRPAYGNLVRVTKDAQDAQDLLTLAMDISASTGKDLESVSMALARAHEGSTGKLKALGIETKDATGKAVDFADIQRQLTDQFGGAQAAAADTAAGKMKVMQARYADLQETIGAALLPVMSELVGVVSGLLDWFGSLDQGTQQWIIRIGMLGGGLLLAARAVKGLSDALGTVRSGIDAARTAMGNLGASSGTAQAAIGVLAVGVAAFGANAYTNAKNAQGLADAIRDVTRASDDQIINDFAMALVKGQFAGKDTEAVMRQLAEASLGTAERLRDLLGATGEHADMTSLLTTVINDEIAAQKQQKADTEASTSAIEDAAPPTEDLTVKTKDLAKAHELAAEKAKAEEDAVRTLFDAIVGAQDGTLRFRDAQRDTKSATEEYALAVLNLTNSNKDQRTTLDDVAAAMDGAQSAMMDQATAAADLYQAQLEANGQTLSASDYAKVYKGELQKLADGLGPNDPLRANLQGYINQLNNVPSSVSTSINAYFSVGPNPSQGGGKWKGITAGGNDNTWGPQWVGENGPEVWTPPVPGGVITPNHKIAKVTAGGGDTYNFLFNGAVADKRTVVDWVHEGLLNKQRAGNLGFVGAPA